VIQVSEFSTLKPYFLHNDRSPTTCPPQIDGSNHFDISDLENINSQLPLSLEVRGFLPCVLLNRMAKIHFRSSPGVHRFLPHAPLDLTVQIYFGYLPRVHRSLPHTPLDLMVQIYFETLPRVHRFLPCIPLDLMIQIHFETSNFKNLNSQLKSKLFYPKSLIYRHAYL
jgi:hypothetical protein